MADKKIIAVVGATGAQGGGLARAILADPNGGFAARAITRDTEQGQGEGAGRRRRGSRQRRPRRRREPEEGVRRRARRVRRHQLLGALLGREGEGAGQEHRRRRQGRRREARDLVDARGHAQVHVAPTTSACRCCRRSTACRTSTPRPKPTRSSRACRPRCCVTSFYWDNLYMFGLAPKKDDERRLQLDVPDGQREAGRHRGRGHRQGAPTASSRRARSTSARPSASPARS